MIERLPPQLHESACDVASFVTSWQSVAVSEPARDDVPDREFLEALALLDEGSIEVPFEDSVAYRHRGP